MKISRYLAVAFLILCIMVFLYYAFTPDNVPLLKVLTAPDTIPVQNECGILETVEEVKSFYLVPQLKEQNIAEVNWIYSTLPVKNIRFNSCYTCSDNMIVIEPSQENKDKHIYFIAIPKKYDGWVKMSAVKRNIE